MGQLVDDERLVTEGTRQSTASSADSGHSAWRLSGSV